MTVRVLPARFRVSLLLGVVVLSACGGGGSDAPTTPAPTPAFSLSVGGTTPAAIAQSASGSATVTVARSGGFTGAVSLAVEGAPSGVTVTPATISVASGSTTASLTIDVALTVPAGSYPLTIRGTASGPATQTTTLTLVVVTRPASVTMTRANTGAITGNAGGPAINFTVILNRIEYLGAVTLELASSLPAGVTATFAPSPTTGNSVVVTLTYAANAVAGSYTAELRGTGTGITAATLSVPFTVVGTASMTVSVSRPTVSTPQNGSGLTSVTIARTNFTTAVTLAVVGLPAGVTGTFENNPTASNSTTLNFTVGAAVVPGSYPLTVSASTPGVPTASVSMTLIITAVGTGGNFSIRFCGAAEDIPIWLGYSVGNSWVRVVIGANNTFSYDLGTQGSVAWVNQRGADDFRITVFAGLRDELAVLTASQCPSPSNRTATGTATGIGVADVAQVILGPRAPTAAPTFATANFSFTALPDGAMDLLATRSSIESSALVVNRVFVQRAVNPANGGSVGTIDLANASVPESKTLTIQGAVGGEQLLASASLRTANGASISLGSALISSGNSGPYRHLAASQLQTGDFHTVQASATLTGGGYTTTRSVTHTLSSPAATAVTLGAALGEPFVFVLDNTNNRARYQSLIPFNNDYLRLFTAGWFQQSGNTRREFVITATEAMTPITTGNRGTNASLTAPNFTNASGFDALWEPRTNLPANYLVTASGWSAAGGISAPLADGVITRSWSRFGPVP
ncbi:MAG: hypothetical protein IPP90_11515 [Gemmatimonadaceae bacterium]|nr:hypothetical protein [Gemmatimonadaceae bacterium]